MSKIVLSEQQRLIFDADRVTTMRVNATAAAKRAAVVKEGDHLTRTDIQAKSDKVPKAPHAELKTCVDNNALGCKN
eukprot:2026163-Pyramimonas_sp.AAC.1